MPVAENLLARNFTAEAPNRVDGRHHLHPDRRRLAVPGRRAGLFNREVVGWSIKPRMTADIVTDALSMAWFRRKPGAGVIFHSDRGSQYASHAMAPGVPSTACGIDEPQGQLLGQRTHRELLQQPQERAGARYGLRDAAHAQADLFEYIEIFYNRRRRHSTLGYSSPVQFLEDWISMHVDQHAEAA